MASNELDRPGYIRLDFNRGELSFALKRYSPEKFRYGRGMSPESVKDQVMDSPKLRLLMEKIAAEEGVEMREMENTVRELLDEIGHKLALPAIRTVALMIRGPLRRVLQAVHISQKGLEELRKAVTEWPVVLLPSHRSYLDFIVVSYFMMELDIQLPAIAAGQDFMNMKFVSWLLRRSGAFFMRRTFGSDQLYKLVFTLYLQTVLLNGDNPMEFFIEGTRSRTAKSLHPKLGLLSMVVEMYLNGLLPDILLFPLSISYERTFEEDLFAWELLGIPKPKESTTGLVKARNLLVSNYGNLFVNIGSAVSLHDVCQELGISRIPHGLHPKHSLTLSSRERKMIADLGYQLLENINSNMMLFPSSLIAAILLANKAGIEKVKLYKQLDWLRQELLIRGAMIDWQGGMEAVVESSLGLLESCVETVSEGDSIRLSGYLSGDKTTAVSVQQLLALPMSSTELAEVMQTALVSLKLAHYRNQLLYFFVPESMVLLTIHCDKEHSIDECQRRFFALHTALSREFVLPQTSVEELFSSTVQTMRDRGLLVCSHDNQLAVGDLLGDEAAFLRQLVAPFAAGVWVMCIFLLSLQGGVKTLKDTINGAQMLAAKLIRGGVLTTFEPLSLDIHRNAMASLTQAGLILEPETELEWRGRLVMVAQRDKMAQLAQDLCLLLFPDNQELAFFGQSSLQTAKL